MDLKQINYFMLVFEERSFSKAAARAHVFQSGLSMQIRRLEKTFDVQLFERHPRGAEPTEAARRFYDHCTVIAKALSLAKQEFAEASDTDYIVGEVRVGLPSALNRGLLPRVLNAFLTNYPQVDVKISEAYTGTLIDWVKGGQVDFAIGARPTTEGGLIQRRIYQDHVVLASGSPLNGPTFTPIDLTQTRDLKLVLPSPPQSFGGIVKQYIAEGTLSVARTIEINGTTGALALMSSDWGLLTPFVALANEVEEDGSTGKIFIYPIVAPAIPFELYLVFDQRKPLNVPARKFVDQIELEFRWLKSRWDLCRKVGDDGMR